MGGYNGTYNTADLSEITVDVIASGGAEAVNFAPLFILVIIIGLLLTQVKRFM